LERIIHVEDEPAWVEFMRNALADYRVDSAQTFKAALDLIRGNMPYDLALVDLNLERDDDLLGGEILDLLKIDYPSTRRIVVTGRPPGGSLRANISDRYGVEEIIIKGRTTIPDLRRVVAETLQTARGDEPAQDVRLAKSELTQRYRDWRESQATRIQTHVRDARDQAREAGRRGGAASPADASLDRWLLFQRNFQHDCTDLEAILSGIRTMPDVTAASARLEQLTVSFSDDLARAESAGW